MLDLSKLKLIAYVRDIPRQGLRFTYKDGPFDEEGILLRMADNSVRAFKNECRHLPMRLDEREPSDLTNSSMLANASPIDSTDHSSG